MAWSTASWSLSSDGRGSWLRADGTPIESLQGCVDIDIAATPFTNTLPIRRLRLSPGESSEVPVAYVAIPALQVSPARQRYTNLGESGDGALYRYESLASGFEAEIAVDREGIVIDYPQALRRVWPPPAQPPKGETDDQ